MDEYSSFPIQHPFDHSADPTQLYNNEKNATECNTMQQISPKFSDRRVLALPHLTTPRSLG